MRKLTVLALPLILAACTGQPAEEATTEDETAAVEETETEAATMTTANGSPPGYYEVTDADGNPAGTSVLNADGTYEDRGADGELIAEGMWEVVDGKTCFTPMGEGAVAMCWTESEPGEDGSFTATSDDGETVTVTPGGV